MGVIVLSRQNIKRLRVLCKETDLGKAIIGTTAGFVAKGKTIQKVPEMKFTPYMKRLFDSGYTITDKSPVHRIMAFHQGITKTYPKKRAFELLPGYAIFTFEKIIK